MRELRRGWIRDDADRARPVVFKRVTHKEFVAHRLIQAETPDVVPVIDGAWPCSSADGDWILAIRDLAAGNPRRVTNGRELLGVALRPLATVHVRFAGRSGELRRLGLSEPAAFLEPFVAVADELRRVSAREQWHLPIVELDEYAELETAIGDKRRVLAVEREWTLVHNDFHLDNIFAAHGGTAKILDWESVCLQVPAWDLVACPADVVCDYLECSGAAVNPTFARQLQAAVLVRMQWLLRCLVRSCESYGKWRAAAATVCLRRVIEASRSPAVAP